MIARKREMLAHGLYWSGLKLLLDRLPERDLLLVLNYHRIGDPDADPFDPGLFSATASQFNEQIGWLKTHMSLITLEEAVAFVHGKTHGKARRCRVLITFDDGYLDNYELAFPILRAHSVQGVFFLVTSMVGSSHVPWWDYIAYQMKTARNRRFQLHYPADLAVDIDSGGLLQSLRAVLELYKLPDNTNPARFIQELAEAAQGDEPPITLRRFIDWEEAREMIGQGMAIGSHTHLHHLLSQLEPDRQRQELIQSRALLKEHLGVEPDALAYPVGQQTSFSDQTQLFAEEAGYKVAFSFYGGSNAPGNIPPYDVKRIGVGDQSWPRFQVQAGVCRVTGKYWP